MAPSTNGFLTAPFAVLFIYCCFLQYQIVQLSYQLAPAPTPTMTAASLQATPTEVDVMHMAPPLKLRGAEEVAMPQPHSIAFEVLHSRSPAPQVPPRLSDEEDKKIRRDYYGGKKDPAHLGGFTVQDNNTISPNLWNFMMSELAVKSLVDVGCGKGFSTRYFYDHGVKVLCIEGSRDALEQTLLPKDVIVQHDYSMGAWWPEDTYDVAWSTEFVEHVGRPFMPNYLPTFHKAALIMITSSGWGGWHHVEVHAPWWWKSRLQKEGFIYSPELSSQVIKQVDGERMATGRYAQQLGGMMVFINPAVASLPKHRHLIGGHGCYDKEVDNQEGGIQCEGKDKLPPAYQALLNCRKDDYGNGKSIDHVLWQCKKNPSAVV